MRRSRTGRLGLRDFNALPAKAASHLEFQKSRLQLQVPSTPPLSINRPPRRRLAPKRGRVTLDTAVLDRITFDPLLMGGRACIRGMRITVAQIVNWLRTGCRSRRSFASTPISRPRTSARRFNTQRRWQTKRQVRSVPRRREAPLRHGRLDDHRGGTPCGGPRRQAPPR